MRNLAVDVKSRWDAALKFTFAVALALLTAVCPAQSPEEQPPSPDQLEPAQFEPLPDPNVADADPELSLDAEPIQAEAELIEADAIAIAEAMASLTVADVIASVYRSYPEVYRARQEFFRAAGQEQSAQGAYDLNLQAFTLSEPTGFYKNYRHGIGVARQMWWGGNIAAGYRVGRGIFQPWYLERETEKGGEFSVSLIQPLLKGYAIDPQRVALFRASLARQAADPILQQSILDTSRDALMSYWNWVAAGATLQAQRDLLELAEDRGRQFQVLLKAGKFAEIDVILNNQLIAERRAGAFESERKFRSTAFKLSLYMRDDTGQPLVPPDDWLPVTFPQIQSLPEANVEQEIALAISRRPEPRQMQIELRQLEIDRQLAQNETLPRFDAVLEGSQDVGQPGTSSDDKGEFVLVAGAVSTVPIQRRNARGKLRQISAKINQVNAKLRLQQDKIGVEIRNALASLQLAAEAAEQAEAAFRNALETLDRYRFAFDRGRIDLIFLNLLEVKANESEIKLIKAQQIWFAALAEYQAAAGLDPLGQAELTSLLPMSEVLDRAGPDMNDDEAPDADALLKDFQNRIGGADAPQEEAQ